MKIVHCIFTMYTGGTQVLVVEILNKICLNNEVSLLILNNEIDYSIVDNLDKRVKVFFINRPKGSRNLYYIFKFNLILKRANPDIVHCHEPNMINFMFFKTYKIIITIHDVGRVIKNVNKYDLFIAISDAVRLDFLNRHDVNIITINNGVNMEKFLKKENYLYSENTPFEVLQVSRLIHTKKGQDILIKAISDLHQYHRVDNVRLSLVGDGESLSFLVNLVIELKLTNKIIFLGNKDRTWIVNNLYNYDLLVQPSLYEGFGLTIIEGFAAGLPVVASNIHGPGEILNDLPYDFRFEVGDYKHCSNKIFDIIQLYKSKEICHIQSTSASILGTKYDISVTASAYLSVYNSLRLSSL